EPLHQNEHSTLAKIMMDDTSDGSRQTFPSYAWTIMLQELDDKHNAKKFRKFWEYCMSQVFSPASSTERKALGLQIFSLAISKAPRATLSSICHSGILQCIVDQRVKPDNYLF